MSGKRPAIHKAPRQQRMLRDGMLESARRCPDKTALVVEGQPYSYAQLAEAAMRFAAVLAAKGVTRGDRVAVYMDNTWPCVISIYGCLLAGGVFLVINPQTKADKLAYILQDSGAKVLVTDAHLNSVVAAALGAKPTITVIASGEYPEDHSPAPERFFELINKTQPLAAPVDSIPNDLAALIYTSGSTGSPKGVMQTHQSMVFAARSIIEYLRLSSDDRIFLALPLAFDYGLYQLLMAMKLGATLILERSFTYLGQVYQRMEQQRATVLPGVPTVFATMISSHKKSPLSFPHITTVTNTAADLSAELVPYLQQIFPNANIFRMYGLTECKRVSYLEPELIQQKPHSVGKAIPGTELFLLSPEGEPVGPGESGILHVRGPHIMAGYWNLPERTAEMLKPGKIPGERILCTHDWFRMDEEGFLYFEGRSDDIIKTRGEKVSPVEVESALLSEPGVKEAAVVGVPDETLGQSIVAYVSLEPDTDLTVPQLKRYCTSRLENFMVPKEIRVLPDLPKTANGKIDKKLLTQMAAQ